MAMNVEEAAKFTGLSKSSLDKLRVYGGGPVFVKIGRRVIYREGDLAAWLAEHARRSTSDQGATR